MLYRHSLPSITVLGKIHKNTTEFISFRKLLNDCIPGWGFAVKENAARIGQFKAASGRKKRDLLAGSYRMNIFVEEVESVDMLIGQLEMEKKKKNKENLERENKKLYEELTEEVKQEKLRADELLSETESLKKYIEKLKRNNETDKNGKDLSTVSPTTRWRYLKDLTTRAQKALWFMKAHSLTINSLEVEENNKKHNLNLSDSSTNPTLHAQTSNQSDKYSTLPEEERKKVEEVRFLMDQFGVSDQFYHHLTMVFNELPRSYLVKQCKHNLNEMSHLTVTPGKSPGVQTSFKELLREQILDLVSTQTFIQVSLISLCYRYSNANIN